MSYRGPFLVDGAQLVAAGERLGLAQALGIGAPQAVEHVRGEGIHVAPAAVTSPICAATVAPNVSPEEVPRGGRGVSSGRSGRLITAGARPSRTSVKANVERSEASTSIALTEHAQAACPGRAVDPGDDRDRQGEQLPEQAQHGLLPSAGSLSRISSSGAAAERGP